MQNVYCNTFNQNQPEYYGRNISESTEGIAVDNVFLNKIVQTNIYSYQNCSIFIHLCLMLVQSMAPPHHPTLKFFAMVT